MTRLVPEDHTDDVGNIRLNLRNGIMRSRLKRMASYDHILGARILSRALKSFRENP